MRWHGLPCQRPIWHETISAPSRQSIGRGKSYLRSARFERLRHSDSHVHTEKHSPNRFLVRGLRSHQQAAVFGKLEPGSAVAAKERCSVDHGLYRNPRHTSTIADSV